jgi:hypothetical protein
MFLVSMMIAVQITRDTGDIPLLMPIDESIFCCSSNGAIRVFALMHNVKRIHLVRFLGNNYFISLIMSIILIGSYNVGALQARYAHSFFR